MTWTCRQVQRVNFSLSLDGKRGLTHMREAAVTRESLRIRQRLPGLQCLTSGLPRKSPVHSEEDRDCGSREIQVLKTEAWAFALPGAE
jgi:hypothetical protein